MADLFDRLGGDNLTEGDPFNDKLPVHAFYAALVAFADGKATRAQIESALNIETTGAQSTQFDTIVSQYQSITGGGAVERRIKYLDRLHTIFMLIESGLNPWTKAEISTWLSEVADGTI